MSDVHIDIPHARKLVDDLFSAASESIPVPLIQLPNSPGVREFNAALGAALQATHARHGDLVTDINTLVDACLTNINNIVNVDSVLGRNLEVLT